MNNFRNSRDQKRSSSWHLHQTKHPEKQYWNLQLMIDVVKLSFHMDISGRSALAAKVTAWPVRLLFLSTYSDSFEQAPWLLRLSQSRRRCLQHWIRCVDRGRTPNGNGKMEKKRLVMSKSISSLISQVFRELRKPGNMYTHQVRWWAMVIWVKKIDFEFEINVIKPTR